MKGKRVLLYPGKDHAGIEGEVSFVKYVLEPAGKSKYDLTREEFYDEVYKMQQKFIVSIEEEEKRIGLSADFDRDLYTLDSRAVNHVLETFIQMYKNKLVYKGVRIVNWDPKLQSSISDSQCVRKQVEGKLFTIMYPLVRRSVWFLDTNELFFDEESRQLCVPLFSSDINTKSTFGIGDLVFINVTDEDDIKGQRIYKVKSISKHESWSQVYDFYGDFSQKIYLHFESRIKSFKEMDPRGVLLIGLEDLDDSDYLSVATTRPETMLGDTALVVNPDDDRYKDLIGSCAVIPIVNRVIPIIFSRRVDMNYGTGVLKLTPSHAPEDYEIMMEWNDYVDQLVRDRPVVADSNSLVKVGYVNVIDKKGLISGPVPQRYKGLPVLETRNLIVGDLESMGLLVGVKNVTQNVLISERSGALVEPLMSSQWFIDVSGIKQDLVDVVTNGDLTVYPRYAEKRYTSWAKKLRDWAISRNLWWGYRLPVWYHGTVREEVDENGSIRLLISVDGKNYEVLDLNNPDHVRVQMESPGEGWVQDEEILDTWFSSGQWPIVCLHVSNLMDVSYPTDVLVSGYDLLIKWDLFMILFGLFKTGKPPFRNLFLTGLVKGTDGQKMSKSRGNVIPFDDIRDNYGVDAFRMNCFYQNKAGRDYSITHETLRSFRNFNNKIWNASKFVINNTIDLSQKDLDILNSLESASELISRLSTSTPDDDEIKMLEEILVLEKYYDTNFEKFRFGRITDKLYSSFWHYFCDKYIESAKVKLRTGEANVVLKVKYVLYFSLKSYLKMLHPFIPFITEEIWQNLVNDGEYRMPMMFQFWR